MSGRNPVRMAVGDFSTAEQRAARDEKRAAKKEQKAEKKEEKRMKRVAKDSGRTLEQVQAERDHERAQAAAQAEADALAKAEAAEKKAAAKAEKAADKQRAKERAKERKERYSTMTEDERQAAIAADKEADAIAKKERQAAAKSAKKVAKAEAKTAKREEKQQSSEKKQLLKKLEAQKSKLNDVYGVAYEKAHKISLDENEIHYPPHPFGYAWEQQEVDELRRELKRLTALETDKAFNKVLRAQSTKKFCLCLGIIFTIFCHVCWMQGSYTVLYVFRLPGGCVGHDGTVIDDASAESCEGTVVGPFFQCDSSPAPCLPDAQLCSGCLPGKRAGAPAGDLSLSGLVCFFVDVFLVTVASKSLEPRGRAKAEHEAEQAKKAAKAAAKAKDKDVTDIEAGVAAFSNPLEEEEQESQTSLTME